MTLLEPRITNWGVGETSLRHMPDRLIAEAPGMPPETCQAMARDAVTFARSDAPKLTGTSARHLQAVWGEGWFGVRWLDKRVWFQEAGIRPFTMTKIAGKTIPMWIDDPTGKERRENPKAKTRVTESGKTQVLIFRRAARHGQRKSVRRNGVMVDVPASYPGAPGRIVLREARRPFTTPGRIGGRIARTNVGVRWRHPGLFRRGFIENGIIMAAYRRGVFIGDVVPYAGPQE